MEFSPQKIAIGCFETQAIPYKTHLHIFDDAPAICKFDSFAHFVEGSNKLICLMPSALPVGKPKPEAVFHRWSWCHHLNENVLSISDPTFSIEEVYCGWFLGDGAQDVVKLLSERVNTIAKKLGIQKSDIIFYGSSMGGFGSLMMASLNEGSLAIAEVPQLDLHNYPHKASIRCIEKYCLERSLAEHSTKSAFSISVIERFLHEKNVPNIKILTNTSDLEYSQAADFLTDIGKISNDVEYRGRVELCVLPDPIGHKPLPTATGIRIIKEELARDWHKDNSSIEEKTTVAPFFPKKENYKDVLDEAVSLSKLIKFIRTPEDKVIYEKTLATLYRASELNKLADWPMLKVCQIEKQWSNSFNQRILDAALTALSRKESLEGFIYCCRGFLYNLDAASAAESIEKLINDCKDSQISNIGNIFRAILSYNLEKYDEYSNFIELFNSQKLESYNPYIAIPAGSVHTDNAYSAEALVISDIAIEGKRVAVMDFPSDNAKYIISISCDLKYFTLYGEYIVKSFTKHCATESVMHISLLDGDREYYSEKIEEWGGINIFFTIVNISTDVNKGPIASILRFMSVYPLMEKHGLPVLVLDLDTVIKKPFNQLVDMMKEEGLDILSRILENGMAPWEKYTGGFAFFANSKNGIMVAKNLAYLGSLRCKTDESQWWIDQNLFEAAIRERIITHSNLSVKNIYLIRDQYCTMPVGSNESKTYTLNNALKQHC